MTQTLLASAPPELTLGHARSTREAMRFLLDIPTLRQKEWGEAGPPAKVTLLLSWWIGDIGGCWRCWPENTTTPDDGGVFVRDGDGVLWMREYKRGTVLAEYWGARADGLHDDRTAVQTASHFLGGFEVANGGLRTASFTAQPGYAYGCDTTGGAFNATLPPAEDCYPGCRVSFYDYAGTWGAVGETPARPVTVFRNGELLLGGTGSETLNRGNWQVCYEWHPETGWRRAKNGGKLVLPRGTVRLNGAPVTLSQLRRAAIQDTCTISIEGSGMGSTHVVFTHAGACFDVQNAHGWGAYFHFHDFSIIGQTLSGQIGLKITGGAWADVDRVAIWQCDRAIDATDTLSSRFGHVLTRFCANPSRWRHSSNSRPNSIEIGWINAGGCTNGALLFEGCACVTVSGQLEGNGVNSTWTGPIEGAIAARFVNCGVEGRIGVRIGVLYCEANGGLRDVGIEQSAQKCRHVIMDSSFLRFTSLYFTINNIGVSHTGGTLDLSIGNCGFDRDGAYTDDAARRVWSIPNTVQLDDYANSFGTATATPDDAGGVHHALNLVSPWAAFNASTTEAGYRMRHGRKTTIVADLKADTEPGSNLILQLSGRFAPRKPFAFAAPCWDGSTWSMATLLCDVDGVRTITLPARARLSISITYASA